MGDALESDDAEVFKETEAMIRRQELLAINHWNVDEFYKVVADGYPWATLTHDTSRDVYTFELPYGVSTLSIQPIPNKNLDLVNKTSEQLLVDFPEADAEARDDSEEAEQAADAANRFLAQDASEQGTNDAVLFDDRVKLALLTASTYIEGWTDPSGGGYVPLQIDAHPTATNPDEPLIGADGMPTTDLVPRYVTAPQGGQFTEDPTQAAPQWQPKIRASKWAREHIRVFPEHLPVDLADEVIILGHCTLAQAKTRWQAVADMPPDDLSSLCDWTPPRYLVLLPQFQRSRWKLSDGKTKANGGSSDERVMFYYHRYIKARPDYPKGADVVLSGVNGGLIIDKKLLAVDVTVSKGGGQETKETRCREIPVVQVTPCGDPTGQDPSGKAYISWFVGATEANAVLGQGYASALQKKLKTPFASSSLSPITGDMVQNARETEDILQVIRPEDIPKPMEPPILDTSFFQMYQLSNDAVDRIASQTKVANGDLNQAKEHSGVAINLAVGQNSIGNSSKLTAVNNAYARWCRIKLELAMSDFTTAQQVAYVGDDGANQIMDLKANDFALIGKVSIKAGTGTGMSQDGKVQYLGSLKAEAFISPDEAQDAARPSFAKRLGLPPNPYEQYVARAIDAWTKGPPPDDPTPDPATGQPKPGWRQQYQAWLTAQTQYEQAQATFQQQTQAFQQFLTLSATAAAGPPSGVLGPEGQAEKAGTDFQTARIQLAVMEQQNPMIGQPPVPPTPPTVPKPWTPFRPRAIDTLPEVSSIWTRKMARTEAGVKYEQFRETVPEWVDCFDRQFTIVRQAAATASTTPGMQAQHAPSPQGRQPSKPTQPSHAAPATPAGAHG